MLHNSPLRRVPLVPQILAPFLRAVGALSDGKLEEAFQHHKEAFMCVAGAHLLTHRPPIHPITHAKRYKNKNKKNRLTGEIYKEQDEEDGEWLLNLMRKLARSLRLLAQKVDRETTRLDPIMVRCAFVSFSLYGLQTTRAHSSHQIERKHIYVCVDPSS